MASAKNTHRAKFSYVKRSDIERLIAAGQIDAQMTSFIQMTLMRTFLLALIYPFIQFNLKSIGSQIFPQQNQN